MQFWGDIVGNYPELVPDLPSNVIALEWGYEANHPFAEKCRLFAEANIPFYVCPGTSSWNSIGGRTDNALGNIRNAIENGIKQGALGVLNTDWGDGGHLQQLPVSYLGWAYGAGLGWAFEKNEGMDVPAVLDAFAFYDKSQIMGRLVYDLGNVYQSPDFFVENSSILFWAYSLPLDMMSRTEVNAQIKNKFRKKKADFSFKLHSIINTIDRVMAPLDEARMDRADAGLINQELRLTAAMLKHGARRLLAILGEETPDQAGLDSEFSALIETYETLWLKRNRPGGLTDSLDRLAGKQPVYPGESWEQFLPGIAD
jgi:hypothetical protein